MVSVDRYRRVVCFSLPSEQATTKSVQLTPNRSDCPKITTSCERRIHQRSQSGTVAFAALHHRRLSAIFLRDHDVAQMGDNIEHVISYWLLYQKFHSPVLAGFAVISHWTPFLFFAVYFGALADRHDCRRVIQSGPGDVRQRFAHLGYLISHRHNLKCGTPVFSWWSMVWPAFWAIRQPADHPRHASGASTCRAQSALEFHGTKYRRAASGPAVGGATMLMFGARGTFYQRVYVSADDRLHVHPALHRPRSRRREVARTGRVSFAERRVRS